MRVESIVKLVLPSAALIFAAGGLMFQLSTMGGTMEKLVSKVDANTVQITRLATQLESQSRRAEIDVGSIIKRVEQIEARLYDHQNNRRLHRDN